MLRGSSGPETRSRPDDIYTALTMIAVKTLDHRAGGGFGRATGRAIASGASFRSRGFSGYCGQAGSVGLQMREGSLVISRGTIVERTRLSLFAASRTLRTFLARLNAHPRLRWNLF